MAMGDSFKVMERALCVNGTYPQQLHPLQHLDDLSEFLTNPPRCCTPTMLDARKCFIAFSPPLKVLVSHSCPSSWLQPAEQNPLSKLTISSWSFACFLTSGRRQAQAEISHTQTRSDPRAHS